MSDRVSEGAAPALEVPVGLREPHWDREGTLAAPAPAKLNLFLHITGRRADGMHTLQTLFQFLDWGDTLRLTPTAEPVIERAASLPGIPEEEDLTLRAARLLARHSGHPGGVRIHVDKRLPVGGGLGGGSSDAATVLLALNRLWGCGMPRTELAALGAALGADIPVFIGGSAAWAEGVGEQLSPVSELAEPWYLLVWPVGGGVSTRRAFADPALTRDHPEVTILDFSQGRCGNDFTPVVERLHPELVRIREWLDRNAPGPGRLTGSGACSFAECSDRAQAEALRARVPSAWGAAVARGRNRHPLADWAFATDREG
ncbi:MAG: 4-(cytidine 5'-diphospho)-2-C-methyl-D-erythritol kinase [Thiohalorhabdus sp.]|uniref:4-(cytidine 5'-diphospho)-2-C-methyl-D-erythritol kinase n=1 Tax=Thiohalorhabdus sp. TaxID=3094134 RepID=UPI00397F2922